MLRDSTWQVVPARELVPGDVVRVRPGDFVPADLRLFTGSLRIDQSAMTGESADVPRSAGESLLSGSVVRRGEGLLPLRWRQSLVIFGYAMIACLVVNDPLKVFLLGLVATGRAGAGKRESGP